jgi:predicted methyltransferase
MQRSTFQFLTAAGVGAVLTITGLSLRHDNRVLDAPARAAETATKNAQVKPDGTARQTARPWTGSPLEFEYANRDQTLRIQSVMDLMGIKPGSRVADIGAGGGWFVVRAARRVGPQGVVYAQEILPKFTTFIAQRARREGLRNVRTILGTTDDPKLPANTMDAVLVLNAYHEFEKPLAMLRQIRLAMKPGARLAFIERDEPELRRQAQEAYAKTGLIKKRVDEKPDNDPASDDHRLAREIVIREAVSAGFRLVKTVDLEAPFYVVVVAR